MLLPTEAGGTISSLVSAGSSGISSLPILSMSYCFPNWRLIICAMEEMFEVWFSPTRGAACVLIPEPRHKRTDKGKARSTTPAYARTIEIARDMGLESGMLLLRVVVLMSACVGKRTMEDVMDGIIGDPIGHMHINLTRPRVSRINLTSQSLTTYPVHRGN